MSDAPKRKPGRPAGSKNKPKVVCSENTTAVSIVAKPRGRPFAPGNNANPSGRPKGSRNRLSETLIATFTNHFEKNGLDAIEAVFSESPVDYLKIGASLIPKQFGLEEGTQNAFLECWRAISEGRA